MNAAAPNASTPDAARWRAIRTRDARADGAFYYAVTTTGVYCRPTCPSRRPRLEHVRVFDTLEAAERAGFRACRRCHPGRGMSPQADARERVLAACRAIERAEAPPTLAALAHDARLSRFHFQRLFKRVVGVSPREYHAARRRARLQEALGRGSGVDAALYDAGYGSPSRVYEHADRLLGMSPAAYRSGAPGAVIRCGYARTALGWLAVAATAGGVCTLELGASRAELAERIGRRFARATLVGADAELETWLAAIGAFLATPAGGLDLPLDVRGTAFQQRVWRALQAIPPGTTVSYGALARRVGAPGAARAAARAVATNPVALAIPCHRVIAADGGIGGYRWGVARKRKLLARERTAR